MIDKLFYTSVWLIFVSIGSIMILDKTMVVVPDWLQCAVIGVLLVSTFFAVILTLVGIWIG